MTDGSDTLTPEQTERAHCKHVANAYINDPCTDDTAVAYPYLENILMREKAAAIEASPELKRLRDRVAELEKRYRGSCSAMPCTHDAGHTCYRCGRKAGEV